jgi:hypothetical protein
MDRVKVISSNIHSVGFEEGNGCEIAFHELRCAGGTDCTCEGRPYHYPTMTAEEHRALMAAHSIGSHFHKRLRNKHAGVRL